MSFFFLFGRITSPRPLHTTHLSLFISWPNPFYFTSMSLPCILSPFLPACSTFPLRLLFIPWYTFTSCSLQSPPDPFLLPHPFVLLPTFFLHVYLPLPTLTPAPTIESPVLESSMERDLVSLENIALTPFFFFLSASTSKSLVWEPVEILRRRRGQRSVTLIPFSGDSE